MLHWRLLFGVAAGVLAFVLARLAGASPMLAALVGWNAGAVAYVAMLWQLFLTASEADCRGRAARQDERRWVILALIVLAVAASLAAIVWALLAVKQLPSGEHGAVMGLSALTLVVSWGLLQSVFALHYAHEHFHDVDLRGEAAGVVFPGQPAKSYLDFVYLAVCVGATAQVSDPGVTSTRLRNLVTAHAAMAFFYNTAVLALGINILASLMSG